MDPKKIGDKIIQYRQDRGITQEKLARAIHVSVSAIGMYERGERVPQDDIKLKIADYFDVNVGPFFYD